MRKTVAANQKAKRHARRSWPLAVLAALTLLVACAPAATISASEVDRLADLLCLEPGAAVADLGAGDGEWSEALARRLGETGRVFATEVEEDKVGEIRERMADAGLDNVTAVLGDQRQTGLPAGCCDAVLVRMVYHHFTDPPKMRASLKEALRPGGVVVIVDLPPRKNWRDLPGVPERGGHGISMEDLVEEMTSAGFEVVSRIKDWQSDDEDDLYCVVFRASSAAASGRRGG